MGLTPRIYALFLLAGVLGASPVAWSGSAKDVFQTVAPSVVVVLGLGEDGATVTQGSGVVVGRREVVTNCHVVEKAAGIAVRQASRHAGGPTWRMTASLLVKQSKRDLCLLYVEDLSKPPAATAVRLGFANALSVGEEVYAVGAPKGLELSLSRGIVSQLRGVFGKGQAPLVQTDAAISPGSSGGGLFNGSGELVGITTFKWKGENLNFALPVEWVRELTQLGLKRGNSKQRLTAEQRRSACLEVPEFDCVIELARNIDNSVSAWLEFVSVQLEVGDKQAARRYLNTLSATAYSMDKSGDRDQLLRNIAELEVQAGGSAIVTMASIDSIHHRIRAWSWVGPEIVKAELESGDRRAAVITRLMLRGVLAGLLKEVQSQGIEPRRLLPSFLVIIAMGQVEAGDKQAARQTLTLAFRAFKAVKSRWSWSVVVNWAHQSRPSWSLEKRGRLIRALKELVPVLVEAGEIVVAYHTAQAVYNVHSEEYGSVLKSIARSKVEATDITGLFKALKTDTFYGFGFFVREVAAAQLEAGNISALLETAKIATDAGYGRWFFGLAGFAWGDIARSQVAAAEIVASFRTAKEMSRGWTGDLDHALREVVAAQVKLGDIAAALTTVDGIDTAGDRAVAYTHIAKAQAKSGDREVARKTFGTAFEAARGMANRLNRLKALRDILEAHVEVGEVAGAGKVAENIENMEPLDSDFISAWASARIAIAQANSGDRETARKTFAAALKTAQGMEDEARRDAALMAIVQSQLEVDDVASARKALASFRSGSVLVRALASIALAEAKSGYKQAAQQDFAVALETVQGVEDPSERDAVLMDIVLPQLEFGDVAGARKASTSFASDYWLVGALTSIALAEAESGGQGSGQETLAAAFAAAQAMEDTSSRDSRLWEIADAQERVGDVVGALKSVFCIEDIPYYRVTSIATHAKVGDIGAVLGIMDKLGKCPKPDEASSEIVGDEAWSEIVRALFDAGHIDGALKAAEYMDDRQLRYETLFEILQEQRSMGFLEKGDFAGARDTLQRVVKALEHMDDVQLGHDALVEIILAKMEMEDFTGAIATAQRMSDGPVTLGLRRSRSSWVYSIQERYATQQAKAGKFRNAMKTAMSIKDPHSRFSSLLRVAVSLKGHTERFVTKGTEDVEASLNLEPSDRTLIQRGLASFNINVGPADGIFGPRTRKALRSWQAKEGLDETGYLTREQAATLIEAGKAARRAGDEGGLTFKEGPRRDAP